MHEDPGMRFTRPDMRSMSLLFPLLQNSCTPLHRPYALKFIHVLASIFLVRILFMSEET